jgi:hypothetical protein
MFLYIIIIYVFIFCFYIFIITYVFIFLLGICFYQKKRVKEKYQKILEKSNSCFPTSKNSFRIFRGSFCFFFDHIRSYSHPFHQIVLIKNYQIILQNRKFHIFLRKSRICRIFLLFLKKISRISNQLLKSSSKNEFFVFDIAIFHFLEDHFYIFDVF